MRNEKLYEAREKLGMTLEEVGLIIGVGKSTIRRWEEGKMLPSVVSAIKLCDALKLNVYDVWKEISIK